MGLEPKKMTIKARIADKLKQKDWGVSDENIREIIKKLLGRICELLPQGNSLISKEFVSVMFNSKGSDDVIDILTEKAMNERDDLLDHVSIRQELEKAINKWK